MKVSTAAGVGILTGVISGLMTAAMVILLNENISMSNKLKQHDVLIAELKEKLERARAEQEG